MTKTLETPKLTGTVVDSSTVQINSAPQAGGAVVHGEPSWIAFRPASPDAHPPFDPRAAGRRAVERHGEVLRRLAD